MQPIYSVRDAAGAGEIKRGPFGTGMASTSVLPSGRCVSQVLRSQPSSMA